MTFNNKRISDWSNNDGSCHHETLPLGQDVEETSRCPNVPKPFSSTKVSPLNQPSGCCNQIFVHQKYQKPSASCSTTSPANRHSSKMVPLRQAILLFMIVSSTNGFSTSTTKSRLNVPSRTSSILRAANPTDLDTRSFILSRDEINPIIKFGEPPKEKIINAHGLWCLIVSLITCPIWLLAMSIVAKKGDNDVNKAEYDNTGKIWSKAWLTATNSYPTISGNMERLKAGNDAGACLFVANHASWLDIPVLCTVLDPVFKFIAKGELTKVPCIGQQLEGVSDKERYCLDVDDADLGALNFRIRLAGRLVPYFTTSFGRDFRLSDVRSDKLHFFIRLG